MEVEEASSNKHLTVSEAKKFQKKRVQDKSGAKKEREKKINWRTNKLVMGTNFTHKRSRNKTQTRKNCFYYVNTKEQMPKMN